VAILGQSVITGSPLPEVQSFWKEAGIPIVVLIPILVTSMGFYGARSDAVLACVIVLAGFELIAILNRLNLRFRGRRLLRVARDGYRVGSNSAGGRLRPWTKTIRVDAIRRGRVVQLRGVRVAIGIPLWTTFNVCAEIDEEWVDGFLERISMWNGGRIRKRGWNENGEARS
jgi:hypothetical protein